MELSTDLLANVTFREQRRGYNQDEVDEFLERLGVALTELQQRLRSAEARATEAEAAGNADEITRTLVLAQRTATAAVDEAREDARRILSQAAATATQRERDAQETATRLESESEATAAAVLTGAEEAAAARLAEVEASTTARLAEIEAEASGRLAAAEEAAAARLAEAEATATAWLDDAETTASTMLASVDATAAARRAEAEERLAALEAEIARREREELGGLRERRDRLAEEVRAMHAYVEAGRDRIRTELEAQLAALRTTEQDAPPWLAAVVQPGRPASNPPTATEAASTTDQAPLSAPSVDEVEGATGTSGAAEPEAGDGESGDGELGDGWAPRALFDRAVEDPTGGLPLLEGEPEAVGGPGDPEGGGGHDDPVLTRARADLADALREAGLLLDTGRGQAPAGAADPVGRAHRLDGGDSTGEVPAVAFDREGDLAEPGPRGAGEPVPPAGAQEGPGHIEWRSVSIPDEPDDDPFLAELRRAVTDTEPLGPRDDGPTQEHRDFDDDPERGRFRLRRNR